MYGLIDDLQDAQDRADRAEAALSRLALDGIPPRPDWFGNGFCRYGHDILLRGRCRYGHTKED